MVSDKRRRELARAKWERQETRRRAEEARARTLRVIGGVALGVAAVVLVGLGIHALVGGDSPGQTIPTENTLTLKQPITPTQPTTTVPTESTPTTGGTTTPPPTAPVTTATTTPSTTATSESGTP